MPGSSFSVEPGIYGQDFGMRTEIDIYIDQQGIPVISGQKFQAANNLGFDIPQQKILTTEEQP